jgi:hypothetical protein
LTSVCIQYTKFSQENNFARNGLYLKTLEINMQKEKPWQTASCILVVYTGCHKYIPIEAGGS